MIRVNKITTMLVTLALFVTTPFSSATADEALQVPAPGDGIGGFVQEDFVNRVHRLMSTIDGINDLPISVSYSSPSIIDLGLVCDDSRDNYIGAYFIFLLREGASLDMPYHQVLDSKNYQHHIRYAQYSGAVKFYYRDIYNEISNWGDNFSQISVSSSSYELSRHQAIPPKASSFPAEVSIDRKTGVARVSTRSNSGNYSYSYQCQPMNKDWTSFIYNFYEAISFKSAAMDWLEVEAKFSSKRNEPSKF